MGGVTFEYPCRSCLQETDALAHGDRNQGTSNPIYSRMKPRLGVRDPGPSASTLGQARGEAHKR